ncbi:MAG: glycosyltransferase family 39 protein [Acidobacteriia bacterium]|nr:glycosyltransferase family 39 protein [Terriglobia bacterium]
MQNTTKTTADRGFRGLWQSHRRWFPGMAVGALALRLFFVLRFPTVTPDGIVYADLAKNWLLHGVYGMSGTGPSPSLIRMPGYPAFLAVLFAVFGADHYNAIRFAQVLIDLGTCLVTADLARRVVANSLPVASSQRVARWAFALTALCPFLANYTAVPLTETPAIFLAVLALDLAVAALQREPAAGASLRVWAACGLAIAAGIYLRPDGGAVLIAVGGYLLYRLGCKPERSRTLWAGVVLGVFALGPLAPWAIRNWREFHRFEPLAPTHSGEPGEYYAIGFDHWTHTWLVDYASVEDISFRMDGTEIDLATVPNRAFDNDAERNRTAQLFEVYNQDVTMTPQLDAQFEQLARKRIQRKPLRYYLELPCLRVVDLWFRPRTEMLPVDSHWWRFREDPEDFSWSLLLAGINLGFVALAVLGTLGWRKIHYAAMLGGFVVVRTVIVTVLTYPEPRYVLQCYPVVMVFAALALVVFRSGGPSANESSGQPAQESARK